MTDQTTTDPTQQPPAPADPPATGSTGDSSTDSSTTQTAPSGPSRGSLVSFTRDNGWGPQEVTGVYLGEDGSGEFAIVAPLPQSTAVRLDDLH